MGDQRHIERGERDAMAGRFYTVLILPHAKKRLRKLHVSRNFVLAVCGILILVAFIGAVAPHLAFKVWSQSSAIETLVDENRKLRDEKHEFEDALGRIGERLATSEGRALELAAALGLESDSGTVTAAGGSAVVEPRGERNLQRILDQDLDVLGIRAEGLETRIGQVDEAWAERVKILASTPDRMPVKGFFSHGYGWRRDPFTGEREFHHGVDIVAETGTPILAPADGVVTRARRMQGYGKMVHISHGYSLASRYGHLSEILVRPGQRVRRGDVIGRVGSTGRSTGPHLHYEMFKAGRRVDPRKFLGDKSF
jgi:murein DD-endopeptidase MepM/ murein hydrolase activator NlpD